MRLVILHKSSNLLKFFVLSTASWLMIATLINLVGNAAPILFKFQTYFVYSALFGLGLGFFQDRGSRVAQIAPETDPETKTKAETKSKPHVNGSMEKGWSICLAIIAAVLLLIVCLKIPLGLANGMTVTLEDPATEIFLPQYLKFRMFFDETTMQLSALLLLLSAHILVAPGRQLKKLYLEEWRYKPLVAFFSSALLAWNGYYWLTVWAVPPCYMLLLCAAIFVSLSKNKKLCGAFSLFAVLSAFYLSAQGSPIAAAGLLTSEKETHTSFWSNGSRIDCATIMQNGKVLGYGVKSDRALYQILPIPELSKDQAKTLQHQTGLPEDPVDFLGLYYRVIPKMEGKEALILGGGIGAEASQCLMHGLSHVTAVESQKWLVDLSKKQSYSPYLNAKVTVNIEDPSLFLKWRKDQYDLILYTGHTAVNRPNPFVAINHDDFLYTAENFTDAFNRLKPGGQLIIATPPADELLRVRLAADLLAITNRLDAELTTPYGNYLVVGKTAQQTGPSLGLIEPLRRELGAQVVNHEHWLVERSRITPITTDDNPFVGGYAPMIPLADVFFALLTIEVALFALRFQTPHCLLQNISKQKCRAFLFGVTFMVLICKATMIYLFEFGTTPPVISQSSATPWLLLLIGAFVSARQYMLPLWMVPAWVFRIAFAFFLIVDYSFNFGSAFFIPDVQARLYVSAVMPWLPAFFAGLLSCREIVDSQMKKEGLGLFLMGSSLGGLFALMSMYHGIASLDVMAGGLCCLILFLMLLSQIEKWQTKSPTKVPPQSPPTLSAGESHPA